MRTPTSSYRLQFGHLTFARARELVVPYLADLGVTDCYASPLLASHTGSEHGYDICDHNALSRQLGSTEDFDALAEGLRARGMGLILDFVPNHMGLDVNANRWWRDVLEHGPSSPYADYFDIDWNPVTPALKGRLLLPILDDGHGAILERGELTLGLNAGSFYVKYHDQALPIEPRSSARIMRAALEQSDADPALDVDWREFIEILRIVERMPGTATTSPPERAARQSSTAEAKARLALLLERSSVVRRRVDASIARFNGVVGRASSFDELDELLEEQPYRLAHWKTAFDEINYRRFFDLNQLGAIRVEDPRVFLAVHTLVLRLIRQGRVTGLRLDHPDGLFDPACYFTRLQQAAAEATEADRGEVRRSPLRGAIYVVAEKVLMPGESMPQDWAIDGTTGYGFLNSVNGLFVDGRQESRFRQMYAFLSGRKEPFDEVVYRSKRLILASSMSSEAGVLAAELKRIADSDRMTRDFTLNALRKTLVEVIACFPVYRTYVSPAGISATDREVFDLAVDGARRRNPVMAPALFLFLRKVLLASASPADSPEAGERQRRRGLFAMRFQQLTAPVQAKGVEDTSYYRYTALASLNEVGGDPRRFGTSVEEFHAGNQYRLEQWPLEMISTATHDTKWGEDARARINVLSEVPGDWRRIVSRLRRINSMRRTAVDREPAPDPNDEYLFYQALVASWPASPDLLDVPLEAPPEFADRLRQYMQKAIREAKVHTSWVSPQGLYEDAVSRFVDTTLRGRGARAFLATFVPFVRRIARMGMVNSLAQLVLKLASPGVSDFYQGTECWQLAFTDPDNRHPVDFTSRRRMLDEVMPAVLEAEATAEPANLEGYVATLLSNWTDGRIKMFMTARGLRLRRREHEVFLRGAYLPLTPNEGDRAHLVAFGRELNGSIVVAVVPRLMAARMEEGLPIGPRVWGDAHVTVPRQWSGIIFRNAFTGGQVTPSVEGDQAVLAASEVLRTCPAALLVSSHARSTSATLQA